MSAKIIDLIFRCYIKEAQSAEFITVDGLKIFDGIKTYGDAERLLAKSLLEQQVRLSQRLIATIEQSGRVTVDEAIKKGVADIPSPLANRLICAKLQKRFDLHGCPQFENGILKIDKRKDYLFPIRQNGLITGLRFEYLRSKRKLKQG